MRAMVIAAALAAAATSANADEPAACYDAAVIGALVDHANDSLLDNTPVPADRMLPRVQADMLVKNWSQVAGPALPRMFWARTVVTAPPDPNTDFLIYLKNQPDGVPSVVDFRYAPPVHRTATAADYPAC